MADDRRRRVLAATVLLEVLDDSVERVVRFRELEIENEFVLGAAICLAKKRKRRRGERLPDPDTSPVRIDMYAENIVSRYTDEEFYSHFRMYRTTFELVILAFGSQLSEEKLHTPDIPVTKKAMIALWILATPDSYRSVADRFGVSKGTAHYCVMEFVSSFSLLKSHYIKWPTVEEMKRTMDYMERKYGFPNVVAAVDGCHISIKEPEENKQSYYNRKGYTSINIQGTCDHKKRILDVCVGWPGSVHDARVWRNSHLGLSLASGTPILPADSHLIADSGYALETYVMTPFKNNGHMTRRQVNYNKHLSSARAVIERCFGLLKCKFRRLIHLDMSRIDKISDVINACCVLHNIILGDEGDDDDSDDDDVEEDDNVVENGRQVNLEASRKRDRIADNL